MRLEDELFLPNGKILPGCWLSWCSCLIVMLVIDITLWSLCPKQWNANPRCSEMKPRRRITSHPSLFRYNVYVVLWYLICTICNEIVPANAHINRNWISTKIWRMVTECLLLSAFREFVNIFPPIKAFYVAYHPTYLPCGSSFCYSFPRLL